jgi:hypothetical protein
MNIMPLEATLTWDVRFSAIDSNSNKRADVNGGSDISAT